MEKQKESPPKTREGQGGTTTFGKGARCVFIDKCACLAHAPSTAGTFWGRFWKNSGQSLETLSEQFPEIPLESTLGPPKPYNSRHLKPPEHFQNSLSVRLGPPLFSEVVPERASQSRSCFEDRNLRKLRSLDCLLFTQPQLGPFFVPTCPPLTAINGD